LREKFGAESEKLQVRNAVILKNYSLLNMVKKPPDSGLDSSATTEVGLRVEALDGAVPSDASIHRSSSFLDKTFLIWSAQARTVACQEHSRRFRGRDGSEDTRNKIRTPMPDD
jgi:hypothetical protein